MEAGESQTREVAPQAGGPCCSWHQVAEFLLALGRWVSCAIQVIGWGPHTWRQTICFAQSPLIQILISATQILTETARIMLDHLSKHCGPTMLMQKINRYTLVIRGRNGMKTQTSWKLTPLPQMAPIRLILLKWTNSGVLHFSREETGDSDDDV